MLDLQKSNARVAAADVIHDLIELKMKGDFKAFNQYAEDVVKGDTTSSVLKDATCETGAVVKVPAFIKVGDVISVDTTTGEYRERKK